ncbi:hypothetical protein SAMN06264364_10362 [Quadrisphaera granulorum]|uniref:Uncharacterized protein n=1 Tax=Quadrisphaera granulorum TaxID=317664 RepID=A0A316ACT2_9ACTN|nr:hypothetical protein [Quadrisphaera granulorum]PWJ55392.1 hypothetical protein BXY45_10362 [Quadrisphaera granulorum]SZE95456.1 hypothetical protein SAMN06264364_10362 [Quadrisphaera granulorum]
MSEKTFPLTSSGGLLLRPSVVAAAGLIGGFAVARATKREIGGTLFGLAGTWCGRQWTKSTGPVGAAVLGAIYTAAMGGSHPLAKRIGAWPAVLSVTAAVVVASEAAEAWGRSRGLPKD